MIQAYQKENESPKLTKALEPLSDFLSNLPELVTLPLFKKMWRREFKKKYSLKFVDQATNEAIRVQFSKLMWMNDYIPIIDFETETPLLFEVGKCGGYHQIYKKVQREKISETSDLGHYLPLPYSNQHTITDDIKIKTYDYGSYIKKTYGDWNDIENILQTKIHFPFITANEIIVELLELEYDIISTIPKINSALEERGFTRLYKPGVCGSDKRWFINGRKITIYQNNNYPRKLTGEDLDNFIERLKTLPPQPKIPLRRAQPKAKPKAKHSAATTQHVNQ